MKSNTTYVKPPCLLFFLLPLLIFSNSLSGQILFQSSFEGNTPFAGATNNQSCCSYSVTASTDHPHDGSKSFRAEVRQNDPAVSSGYRAELTFPNISDQGDMWYGFSMYFDPNNSAGNDWSGCCGHVLQWHPTSSSGGAVLDLRADGGKFDFCVNPAGGGSTMHQSGTLKDIVPGRWYDIVMHVNWSSGSDGLLEVWIDGSLYYTRQVSWTSGRYFKFGMNRWNMTNTWTVFYDNLKIGRNVTYADVAPSSSTTPPTNQAPVANAGNDISLTLPALVATLNGSATDADGTIASYSWSRVSGPADFSLLNPLSAVTSLLGLIQGTYVFRLTVTDNDGATDTDDVSVTVNPLLPPPNQSPTANAGNNITITLPANSTNLNGSGADSDGTIASYRWSRVSGPTTFTFANAGAASTALTGLVEGTYVFRLTVTDNDGATGTDNITVVVNPAANQPPTANAGNNITITLPANSANLNGSGADSDGMIASYRWSRVSGPTTFTFANAGAASTALTGLVEGTYVFRLTVTDNDGATGTDNITVVVNPAANQPPTANAGNNITITLPANSANLNGSGADSDGMIASYRWSRVSGPTTFTFANAGAASTALTGLVEGTYVFRLTVTDNDGATGTDNITVVVNPAANQPPTANAGNNIGIALPANSTNLNGSGTDPDGTIESYAWSRVSGPATYTFADANAASTRLSGLVQGTYVFRLTVRDNDNVAATDDITVTVNAAPPPPNQPPVANSGNNISITLPTNATTLNGSGSSDADGTIANYAWSRVSGPTTYTFANANAVSTALTGLVQGTYVFRLTVRDDDGAVDTDDITVTVNAALPVNELPVANAGNNINITLPVNSTNLNGGGSDADGTIASYAWTRVSGPTTYTFTNANGASTGLTGLVQGTYVFRLTVRDNDGAVDTDDVTVTVNAALPPPNQPPTANAGNNISITLPVNSTTLNGSGADADGTIASYGWSRVSGPTAYAFTNASAASTGLTGLVQGTYVFRLTVRDNDNATATDDLTVTVNAAPPPPNQPPVANAGNNISITLPVNSTTLNGSGADADGTIASYGWSRVSGPTAYAFTNASTASTGLTGLVQGTYVFRLTVRDNDGAVDTDEVTVTVNAAPPPPNQLPTANAGNDITITLPANSTTLNGSGTDPNGTIAGYTWSYVSGPSAYAFGNANAASTIMTGLVQGVYVCRLTVRDNAGATDTDDVTVRVNAAPPPVVNQLPIARAGSDIILYLPDNSVTLNGNSSTDPDGLIAGYEWKQLDGPSQVVLSSSRSSSIRLTDLMLGAYVFELSVTDNRGGAAKTKVTVTVKNKNGESLACTLYPNPASHTVNIQYIGNNTGKVRINIYDVNKRHVYGAYVTKNQVTLNESFNIARLSSGVYFLEVVLSGNKNIVRKFVKH